MRSAARLIGSLTSLVLLGALACGEAEYVRPNLVLISVDSLRADHLTCYGGEADLGAEVCAVGETGARYAWAFTTASAGGPAAASMLTSQYPRDHGVAYTATGFLRDRTTTLAQALRSGGYATAAFVGSPELNRSRNFQQGFDVFDDRRALAGVADSDVLLGEAALAWVERAPRPFFVWIHLGGLHDPLPDAPVAARGAAPPASQEGSAATRYRAALRRLDRRLSQVVAVLDSLGEAPGILLVGLHGQSLRDGAEGHGAGLDLEQIRVPLLWRPPRTGPGRGVGRRVETPVSLLDVAPTLLDAAGLRWPASFQGLGLPYGGAGLENESGRALFAEHPDEIAVIVDGDYASIARRDDAPGAAARRRSADLRRAWADDDEALPAYDGARTSAERLLRLAPQLAGFLGPEAAPAAEPEAETGAGDGTGDGTGSEGPRVNGVERGTSPRPAE